MADEHSGDVKQIPAVTERATAEQAKTEGTVRETPRPREIGGPPGPEPTRYGDWEKNGRCSDF